MDLSLDLSAQCRQIKNYWKGFLYLLDFKLGVVHKLRWQVFGFFDHPPSIVYTFYLIKVDIFWLTTHFLLWTIKIYIDIRYDIDW